MPLGRYWVYLFHSTPSFQYNSPTSNLPSMYMRMYLPVLSWPFYQQPIWMVPSLHMPMPLPWRLLSSFSSPNASPSLYDLYHLRGFGHNESQSWPSLIKLNLGMSSPIFWPSFKMPLSTVCFENRSILINTLSSERLFSFLASLSSISLILTLTFLPEINLPSLTLYLPQWTQSPTFKTPNPSGLLVCFQTMPKN